MFLTPTLRLLSYLALHLCLNWHASLLALFCFPFFLRFFPSKKGGRPPPLGPKHYPGDTHANLSRRKANLSRLIRKSAGHRPSQPAIVSPFGRKDDQPIVCEACRFLSFSFKSLIAPILSYKSPLQLSLYRFIINKSTLSRLHQDIRSINIVRV